MTSVLKRGPWTPEEDQLLISYIYKKGEGRWRTLPKKAGLRRCGKSCRLRWMNYLRPSVKRGQMAPDEEDLILRLHRLLGNRWSLIAGRIPGRTDNEIKNYWNTHLSKKLISQGIDPRTHKPLNSNQSSTNNIKSSSQQALQLSANSIQPIHTHAQNDNSTPINAAATFTLPPPDYQFQSGCGDMGSSSLRLGVGQLRSGEDDAMMNHINNHGNDDDVFTTFLNSLIIEDDAFSLSNNNNNNFNLVQQQNQLNINAPNYSEPNFMLNIPEQWDDYFLSKLKDGP